jgi:acyl carrier protein
VIERQRVEAVIYRAIAALNDERGAGDAIPAAEGTVLFGAGSPLDSLALVSLISDVETTLTTEDGLDLSLADDRALSRTESPYRTVGTLRDYVLELARGA